MDRFRDFLTIGSMEHASHIALSVALQKPDNGVTVIDGDVPWEIHPWELRNL